jgi:hypothetical protein
MQATKPCNCGKQKTGEQILSANPKAHRFVTSADKFTQATLPIVRDAGMQIATGVLDPVTGLLVLRRRFGNVALEFEDCSICRKDIEMAMEFDQLMIDAKAARTEYLQRSHWRGFQMFLNFQMNVARACLRWAPETKWIILFSSLGITALILRFLGML